MKKIAAAQVKEILEREHAFRLIDVLPPESFQEKHLPGAVNVPVDGEDFLGRIRSAVPDRSERVVVYCADRECDASPRAVRRMEEAGYTDVYDMGGGLEEWERSRFPLEGEAVEA